jgi:anaerobic selenocysteine-containing dehydrogenase
MFAQQLLGSRPDPAYRAEVIERPDPRAADAAACGTPGAAPRPGIKVVKSACFNCNTTCEALIFVDEASGRVLKVEGDPESPITKGVLCSKGLAAKDLVHNPERLQYPLRRVGERGGGQWERISWDQALSTIAEKLLQYREQYGPQGIAFLEGTRRGWSRVYSRLANAFGAVNHGAAGWAQCLWPRLVDNTITFGGQYMEAADYEHTNCMLVWGVNPPVTWAIKAAEIMDARERGVPLIVVDPNMSETAAKADLWLQLRPGTDTALALAMIHVVIEQDLVDHEFVANWTVGFDELKQHVSRFTPDWGERITRVPAGLIVKAAELYAGAKHACLSRCLALDEVHDSLQACRATSLLASITGNIGVPGGNIMVSTRGETSQNTLDFIGHQWLPPESLPLRRGYDEFPLLCGKLSPVPSNHMPTLWETIATGEPYPIKAALIFGSNAMVSYSNVKRVEEAIHKLDFLAVCDLFLTPTAALADIVLPASSWLERDNMISSFQTSYTYTIVQQKAVTVGEARSDVDICIDLANRLGLGELFWKDSEDLYNHLLKPVGLTLRELQAKRRIYAPLSYRQYEKSGFKTPSGKIELYSGRMAENRCHPLPPYTEPFESPLSTPQLAREYPYILTTGGRVPFFRHTENRQNPMLREMCPRPPLYLHPDTAALHGIRDGDQVVIETQTGSALGYARVTEGLQRDVIQASPGWWGEENINRVIPWGNYAEGIGTVCMRGILCRVKPAQV